MTAAYSNILIIKPSSLGDIVLALPVLSALRRNFPAAGIGWLARPEFAPLLQGHPHLDEIIPFDRKYLAGAWHSPRAIGALGRLIGDLRQRHFDAVLDLQGLFRTAALAWLSRCPNRLGLSNAREFAGLFYSTRVTPGAGVLHLADHYIKVVQALGATDLAVEFILPRDQAAEQTVAELLTSRHVDSVNYAVLVPSSAQPKKCWPASRFADLADRIAAEYGLAIVAIGTKSESQIVDQLVSCTKTPVVNLAGQTTIPQLVALLRTARLVVSNDTGPGHIAAALGRPLVMLIGKHNPARIAPYGRPQCVVARDAFTRGTEIKSRDPKYDIRTITADEVYSRVVKQLKAGGCRLETGGHAS